MQIKLKTSCRVVLRVRRSHHLRRTTIRPEARRPQVCRQLVAMPPLHQYRHSSISPISSNLVCGRFELRLEHPLIMGIVNVTPGSFSTTPHHVEADAAIARAHELIAQGAEMLAIG